MRPKDSLTSVTRSYADFMSFYGEATIPCSILRREPGSNMQFRYVVDGYILICAPEREKVNTGVTTTRIVYEAYFASPEVCNPLVNDIVSTTQFYYKIEEVESIDTHQQVFRLKLILMREGIQR